MAPNPFDKPKPFEWTAPQVLPYLDAGREETAHLSVQDQAFFQAESEAEPLLPQAADHRLDRMVCLLLSVFLNILVLIILALILLPDEPDRLSVEGGFSDEIGDQLDMLTLDEGNLNPFEAEEYEIKMPETAPIEDMVILERKEEEILSDAETAIEEQSRIDIRELLSGRTDPGMKDDLLAKYGGTKQTREAVLAGLRWLNKQQDSDGFWSLKGPYRDGVVKSFSDNQEAASGLALLAFQGDGNTRSTGDYQETVRKGWKWLLKRQNEDGSFFAGGKDGTGTSSSGRFYTQAIVTIALCELVAMEKVTGSGADLRGSAQKAVDYLVRTQNKKLGGWRYEEGVGSDLSVTGWVLMALQTARAAELFVPSETLERIGAFLDSVAYDGGSQYFYSVELPEHRPSMTATGLLCREYLGWDRKNETLLSGAAELTRAENLIRYAPLRGEEPDKNDFFDSDADKKTAPFATNVYGWYSTSMMLKHLGPGSKYWRIWNKALSSEIPAHQEGNNSPEAGSWDPSLDAYRFGGGRLYITTLSILCLEVYYRHLSLFNNSSPNP